MLKVICSGRELLTVYFERYESGRLYAPVEKKWEALVLKALPYVFIGSVVIGLLALVWHLFLRGG